MAGNKRNKVKKALSPTNTSSTDYTPPPLAAEDVDLMDDLMAQLDSKDKTVQSESANVLNELQLNKHADELESQRQKQDKKSRFLARQARKAATLAQSLSPVDEAADERLKKAAQDEELSIKRTCEELGLRIHQINPDGHCLFSAIGDQLALLKIVPSKQSGYTSVRLAASHYIYTHPEDFLPFLPSDSGEDGAGATDSGLMNRAAFERYCASIRDTGVWGGEPEILALSRAYNVSIHVVQGGTPPVVIHRPRGPPTDGDMTDKNAVRISYHRRMYGLGEHYNSLRPRTGLSGFADKIQEFIDPAV